jgi:hypothetical protein
MKDSTAERIVMGILIIIGYGLIGYCTSPLVAAGVFCAIWANNVGQM